MFIQHLHFCVLSFFNIYICILRFGELVNREMMWTITEIVAEPGIARRVKLIKQFIKVHSIFVIPVYEKWFLYEAPKMQ